MLDLEGKAGIVTGASRGIGAAAARELARHGVSVVLAARTATDLDAVAESVREAGGRYVDFDGATRRYNQRETLIDAGMAAGSPALLEALFARLKAS